MMNNIFLFNEHHSSLHPKTCRSNNSITIKINDFYALNFSKNIDNLKFSSNFLLKNQNSIQRSILIDIKNSKIFRQELAIHIY
jgi:hypothetical protein